MVIIMKKLLCIFVSALLVAGVFGVTASASAKEEALETAVFNAVEFGNYLSSAEAGTKLYSSIDVNALYNVIYNGILNSETKIDVSSYQLSFNNENTNLVGYIIEHIVCKYPELSFKKGKGFAFYYNDKNEISKVSLTYNENYALQYAEYKEILDNIVANIPQGLTDLEKVLYTYNYLALNFRYEQNYLNVPDENLIRDVYNFFTKGEGVCAAYSRAFIAIMNEIGIKATYVIDDADDHAWNIVYLDGKPYHIDCTHADPTREGTVEENSEDGVKQVTYCYDTVGLVSYDHFLKSDDTIKNACEHHKEYTTYEKLLFGTDIICDDSTYESGYVWLNGTVASPFTYCDGSWYYMNYDSSNLQATLLKTNNFLNSEATEAKVNDIWYVNADSSSYSHYGYKGSVFTFGNEVCYSTRGDIKLYNPKTNTVSDLDYTKPTLTEDQKAKYIYGCSYDGHGKITLLLKKDGADLPIDNITIRVKMGSNAVALAATQKFILTGECDKNWGYFDVSGDRGIDIRDLVALKKRAASVSGGNSGEYFPGNW